MFLGFLVCNLQQEYGIYKHRQLPLTRCQALDSSTSRKTPMKQGSLRLLVCLLVPPLDLSLLLRKPRLRGCGFTQHHNVAGENEVWIPIPSLSTTLEHPEANSGSRAQCWEVKDLANYPIKLNCLYPRAGAFLTEKSWTCRIGTTFQFTMLYPFNVTEWLSPSEGFNLLHEADWFLTRWSALKKKINKNCYFPGW